MTRTLVDARIVTWEHLKTNGASLYHDHTRVTYPVGDREAAAASVRRMVKRKRA